MSLSTHGYSSLNEPYLYVSWPCLASWNMDAIVVQIHLYPIDTQSSFRLFSGVAKFLLQNCQFQYMFIFILIVYFFFQFRRIISNCILNKYKDKYFLDIYLFLKRCKDRYFVQRTKFKIWKYLSYKIGYINFLKIYVLSFD